MRKWTRGIVVAAGCLVLGAVSAEAAVLYGVTGDGATTPESLFVINQSDASSTFFMALGNGDDGETIAYNPNDGLMYHASGISDGDRFWEAINLNTRTIVLSTQFVGPNVDDETLAITYNPNTGNFLAVDRDDEFFDVTPLGAATDIGDVEDNLKGLAFVGDTLYGAEVFSSDLHVLDPTNGATLLTVGVTLPGFEVLGLNGLATDPDTGELWGIVRANSDEGDTFRFLALIDPLTGIATSVGALGDNFAGIAFVPSAVPEPAALGLLGLGILGIAGLRRRKAA
ncbi:MAG TPA: PEP-CTERM sorting domain-containing protein [Pedomonas sp.]|uniref:PEP-CTERM sorting domain-containing protein n=1 Tax=Pedomonas sp. TaxID=2976421 RepID=UPI002F405E95